MLVPCIDLQSGRVVQLIRGRKLALALGDVLGQLEAFHRAGYRRIHVIDLDAAMRTGSNARWVALLCRHARALKMRVWAGGGVRTAARAAKLIAWGAERVIVDSAALQNGRPNLRTLESLRRGIGRQRLVIALDTWRGHIVVRGWKEKLRVRPQDVMPALERYCSAFLCTYVDNEGTMRGTNLRWFRDLRRATGHPITAAGGIRSHKEVRALARLKMDAAVGMAIYKGKFEGRKSKRTE